MPKEIGDKLPGRKAGSPGTMLILGIISAGVLPILLYWGIIGRAPSVTVPEAIELLSRGGENVLLVDVRPPALYAKGHIEGSVNWPVKKIAALQSFKEIPGEFKGPSLYLLCNAGISSAYAAGLLKKLGMRDVYSVAGGIQEWQSGVPGTCPAHLRRFMIPGGEADNFPNKNSSLVEQVTLSVAAFGIKPLYMILSLLLFLVLLGSRQGDLYALRWAMLSFFCGEAFCAVNYLFFAENSHLVEYLHMYGMVLAFGFTTYAILTALDMHLLHYSDRKKTCSALHLCRSCYKNDDVVCAAERLFKLILIISIAAAFMPLSASPFPESYTTEILGTAYQSIHPVLYQIYEIRVAPVIALLLFAVAFVALRFRRGQDFTASRMLYSAGMGFLGFSLFRLILFALYRHDLVWFAAWEELTELLYVAAALYLTWLFHGNLFLKNRIISKVVGKKNAIARETGKAG